MTHHSLDGRCHCGRIKVHAELTQSPEHYTPRCCDCDFCRMHNAAYISDPQGRLTITARTQDALHRYRQGAELADMLLCTQCGVLVGACYKDGSGLYGAVNTRLFKDRFGAETPASPKRLDPDEKRDRWKAVWFKDVRIDGS